jgi:hypothetical protein
MYNKYYIYYTYMKVALFLDTKYITKALHYIYFLFLEELKNKFNYDIDFYTPDYITNSVNITTSIYLDRYYVQKYNHNIIWGEPNANDYDVIIIANNFRGKRDLRQKLASRFIKHKKKVLSLKLNNLMEHRFIYDNVLYGVNTLHRVLLEDKFILPAKCNKFIFPSLNLSTPKPDALTKIEFYKKYKLNPDLKLITFYIGQAKKWVDRNNTHTLPIYQFFNKFKHIKNILTKNGYQLIFKLHKNNDTQQLKNLKLKKIFKKTRIISHEDAYESTIYSNFAITYATTMVYELYLYNLPVLEIGSGLYYPGWFRLIKDNNYHIHNNPLKQYNDGKDLIYGNTISLNDLTNNTDTYISSFLNTTYNIKQFKYITDNPIYGNSYYDNINTAAKSLANQLDILKLK